LEVVGMPPTVLMKAYAMNQQHGADDVKINNMDADTRLPRRDKVMNPFVNM